ncbi:hypothetical protein [Paenibacillus physcomitrellae]|uniref:Uncharacterized protein n=1 Tax=Paenibacillus physcomitrellae TaxID=1619311 RepID=A0ABQ1GK57_9BACL|nr:hypothetical protein [Paenibacillus physcomitrellae]GGA45269.1 hypothetical protein GCM10010917_33200 [Paenibacillus physcomitrellae]
MYQFRSLQDRELASWTTKLLDYPFATREDIAGFRGKLIRLFGKPAFQSVNLGAAFEYVIEARDEERNVWILTAYEGPAGPALGGNQSNEGILAAARQLNQVLALTSPADYEETLWDEETGNKFIYGCKQGICYFRR